MAGPRKTGVMAEEPSMQLGEIVVLKLHILSALRDGRMKLKVFTLPRRPEDTYYTTRRVHFQHVCTSTGFVEM